MPPSPPSSPVARGRPPPVGNFRWVAPRLTPPRLAPRSTLVITAPLIPTVESSLDCSRHSTVDRRLSPDALARVGACRHHARPRRRPHPHPRPAPDPDPCAHRHARPAPQPNGPAPANEPPVRPRRGHRRPPASVAVVPTAIVVVAARSRPATTGGESRRQGGAWGRGTVGGGARSSSS